ncbi:hypothetical protein F5Y18DRAFT_443776 [Xylariaceae sp. FL1019]|nr:hypothetical protein F5Y18DRAFT_443776 [Xylariaceae sp. FL1019]
MAYSPSNGSPPPTFVFLPPEIKGNILNCLNVYDSWRFLQIHPSTACFRHTVFDSNIEALLRRRAEAQRQTPSITKFLEVLDPNDPLQLQFFKSVLRWYRKLDEISQEGHAAAMSKLEFVELLAAEQPQGQDFTTLCWRIWQTLYKDFQADTQPPWAPITESPFGGQESERDDVACYLIEEKIIDIWSHGPGDDRPKETLFKACRCRLIETIGPLLRGRRFSVQELKEALSNVNSSIWADSDTPEKLINGHASEVKT